MAKHKKNKMKKGPSVPSKMTEQQEEWHTATSDDEEAYVAEMESLYKD